MRIGIHSFSGGASLEEQLQLAKDTEDQGFDTAQPWCGLPGGPRQSIITRQVNPDCRGSQHEEQRTQGDRHGHDEFDEQPFRFG